MLSFLRSEGRPTLITRAPGRRVRGGLDVQRPAGLERRSSRRCRALRARRCGPRAARPRHLSRLARDRAGCARRRGRSISAARSSARCARRPCSRSAASTPAIERVLQLFASRRGARDASAAPPGARKGCSSMSVVIAGDASGDRPPRDRVDVAPGILHARPLPGRRRRGSRAPGRCGAPGAAASPGSSSSRSRTPARAAAAVARRGIGGAARRRAERTRPARDHPRRARARLRAAAPAVAASLSRATVIKVGQLVGASRSSSAPSAEGDELTVEAHSIRIDVGRLQPQVSEHAPLAEGFFCIYERIAQRLAMGAARIGPAPVAAVARGVRELHQGPDGESAGDAGDVPRGRAREFPAFDPARLALWDVRYEQGDHAAALAAAKRGGRDVAAGGARAVARRHLPARIEGFRDGGRHASRGWSIRSPADHGAAARAPRPVLNNLGIVQLRRGASADAGSATYFLTRATDADPEAADYQFNLGYAYLLDRNYKALAVLAARGGAPRPDGCRRALPARTGAAGRGKRRSRRRARRISPGSSRRATRRRSGPAAEMPFRQGLERLRTDLDPRRPCARRRRSQLGTARPAGARDLPSRSRPAAVRAGAGPRGAARAQASHLSLAATRRAAHLLIGRIHLRAGRPADAVEALKISIWSEDSAPAHVVLAGPTCR